MELTRRQIDTVPVDRVTVDEHERNHLDAVRPDDLFGKVRGAVGHDPDRTASQRQMRRSRPAHRGVLGLHVLGLVSHQVAEALQVLEDIVGLVGVDVQLEHVARADDDHRVALLTKPVTHLALRGQSLTADEGLGAEAKTFLSLGVCDHGHGGGAGLEIAVARGRQRVSVEEEDHSFEEAHESLGSRVHHTRRLEHRKQLGSPRQGLLGLLEHMLDERRDVVGLSHRDGLGRLAHDGEDRAFDGLFDGRV